VQAPFVAAGEDIGRICYFGESVLARKYRGQGIGVRFFEGREAHARATGFAVAAFCAVARPEEHPMRPKDYVTAGWVLGQARLCAAAGTGVPHGCGAERKDAGVLEQGVMKLALAQFGVEAPRDFGRFIGRVDRLAAEAGLAGAGLLVLPEYFSMVLASVAVRAPDIAAELDYVVSRADALIAALREVAMTHGLYLLAGSVPMRGGDGKLRNRAPFIAPSGAVAYQDKQAMTRFEAEEWGIAPGRAPCVFETAFGRIGVSVCYDSEFPLHARAQMVAGAKLLIVPCCTATPAGFNRVRFSARARAIENQCFVAVSPLVGDAAWSGAIDTNVGHAALFTPCDVGFPADGVAACGPLNEAHLLLAELDFDALDAVRAGGDVLNHRDWVEQVPPAPVTLLL
jgi:predicted amidohydrolase